MKQKLLVLTLVVMLASCGSRNTPPNRLADTDGLVAKREIKFNRDSLTPIFVPPPLGQNSNDTSIDSFTLAWWMSRQYTSNWQNFLTDENYRNEVIRNSTYAYIIPMSNVKYLMDQNGATYLIVYLAVDSQKKMTLVYEGGVTLPSSDTLLPVNDTIYEIPVKRAAGTKYALDNAYPCPTCADLGFKDVGYNGPQQQNK